MLRISSLYFFDLCKDEEIDGIFEFEMNRAWKNFVENATSLF